MKTIVKSSIPPSTRRVIKKRVLYPGAMLYGLLTHSIRLMPDFIIIGAARSGTTSLFKQLRMHPHIVPALTKEVHFFDLNFKKGTAWYRAHFPSFLYKHYINQVRGQKFATGEASPYYIFHPYAPKRIFEMIPQVKLIVMLRNPVDRAYSHYHHVVRYGQETLSFEEAIEREVNRLRDETEKMLEDEHYYSLDHRYHSYLVRGIYADQLKVWLDLFPKEQLLIIRSEDYFSDSAKTLKQFSEFLAVPNWEPKKIEKARSTGYTKMDPATRSHLTDYFKPHNQRLYELLGIDFDWDK